MNTYATTIKMSKGYSGKTAAYAKGYIARITGTDTQYGLCREFVDGKIIGDEYYRKSKCTWEVAYDLTPGLYELLEGGEKYLWLVSEIDGQIKKLTINADRALAMAKMMDDGATYTEARLATKPVA